MITGHNNLECHDLLGRLSGYIDGELETAVCAQLEAHLAQCSDCRVMVDTLRRTVTLYRCQRAPELPQGVQQRLYQVLNLD